MKFRTELKPVISSTPITYSSTVFAIGSCFVEHVISRMKDYCFDCTINPYGILYNPISISQCLNSILQKRIWTKSDLFTHRSLFHNYAFHGSFSHQSSEAALRKMNDHSNDAYQALIKADFLVLSLGTSYAFRHIENDEIVANCHKVEAKKFERVLLNDDEILSNLKHCFESIRKINDKISFVLTVSPVRHLRDGLIENNLSKAHLLKAVHQLVDTFEGATYFPSYELLLDDLRDYRFFGKDLMHPSEEAIEYIWSFFKDSLIGESDKAILKEIANLRAAGLHRPLFPESKEHKAFISDQKAKLISLGQKYPEINFEALEVLFED